MALPWEVDVDGYDLNDGVKWITVAIPGIDHLPVPQQVLVELAGDYPWFVRQQPAAGSYTVNLAMAQPCTDADWFTRMEELKSHLGSGLHTLTVKVRGMNLTRSVDGLYDGMGTNFRERLVSFTLMAPNPTLT